MSGPLCATGGAQGALVMTTGGRFDFTPTRYASLPVGGLVLGCDQNAFLQLVTPGDPFQAIVKLPANSDTVLAVDDGKAGQLVEVFGVDGPVMLEIIVGKGA